MLITAGIGALTFSIIKVNGWGWQSPGVGLSLAVSLASLTLFVRQCLGAADPFIDPALFRIRSFSGAALVMAPYSVAFGALLFSVGLWEQTVWGWSALRTGLSSEEGVGRCRTHGCQLPASWVS